MKNAVRPVVICGHIAIVPLTKGFEAIIDAADAADVGRYNWAAAIRGKLVYAYRSVWTPKGTEMLHRRLLREPKLIVDHIDGDGLNNRRSNLRIATKAQNAFNSKRHKDNASGFKGVSFHRARGRWTAWIRAGGESKYLGLFDTPEEAHAAYCFAARKIHGQFARFG